MGILVLVCAAVGLAAPGCTSLQADRDPLVVAVSGSREVTSVVPLLRVTLNAEQGERFVIRTPDGRPIGAITAFAGSGRATYTLTVPRTIDPLSLDTITVEPATTSDSMPSNVAAEVIVGTASSPAPES